MSFSTVAIFCEDYREETGGSSSVLGIMKSQVNIVTTMKPVIFPKLSIFVICNFTNESIPSSLSINIQTDKGQILLNTDVPDKIIEDSIRNLATTGVSSIRTTLSTQLLRINSENVIRAFAIKDGVRYLAGALKITISEDDIQQNEIPELA